VVQDCLTGINVSGPNVGGSQRGIHLVERPGAMSEFCLSADRCTRKVDDGAGGAEDSQYCLGVLTIPGHVGLSGERSTIRVAHTRSEGVAAELDHDDTWVNDDSVTAHLGQPVTDRRSPECLCADCSNACDKQGLAEVVLCFPGERVAIKDDRPVRNMSG
jgi:hypothetical protein